MKQTVLDRAEDRRPAPHRRGRRAGIAIGVIALLGLGATSGGVALGMIPQPFTASAPAPAPSPSEPAMPSTPASAPVQETPDPVPTPTPHADTRGACGHAADGLPGARPGVRVRPAVRFDAAPEPCRQRGGQ
ncbi:hypothetical protein [Curtobacterium sp. MCPF17_052]|uniref:hypothetical protein n=1 Tax=Curtobacterium sp. MCPF17_052 TaxID=2175655 RepID=UPI0024DFA388|nr:hypothetical protein [Curtobacterium sp. MCPF17_052]WIB13446.1 hypothetical protein DEJ36_06520 [Curtobacterium sp. MCPF17_052]